MTDNSHVFRQLACSDMVRKAAQANHQPILNDGRIDALLQRLSHAEQDPHGKQQKEVRTETRTSRLAGRVTGTHIAWC